LDETQGPGGRDAAGVAGGHRWGTNVTAVLRVYLEFVAFLFGAAIGSFLNVCIHRMPRDQSIVSPPSHCPHCGQPIPWRDNLPLLSYLLLRGRCRNCRARITPRYFLVELLTATLFLLVVLKYGWQWIVPAYWVLLAGLVAATFIDFEHYIIPNELTYGGVLLGLCFSFLMPALQGAPTHSTAALRSLLGIATGGLTLFLVAELGKLALGRLKVPLPPGTVIWIVDKTLFVEDEQMAWPEIFYRDSDRIRFHASLLGFQDKIFENAVVSISETAIEVNGTPYDLAEAGPIEAMTELVIIPREAMGLGDAKLLAAIGAFLGWQAALFSVFASSMVGGLVSVALIAGHKKDWQSRIPYGPYIALGALIWVFYGQTLVEWYLNLIKG
jgi:leader peptidase (prepilin peptidase)/N-methyltransferase